MKTASKRTFALLLESFVAVGLQLLILAILVSACNRMQSSDPTLVLQKSFKQSDPATKAEVDKAGAALKSQNYTEAVNIFNRLVDQRTVSKEQRQAIGQVIGHTMKNIDRNPQLDNPALYQGMSRLIEKTYGEN